MALSSIAGHLTHRHLGAYAVAKAGIEMLVRNAADELGAYGVRVNGVRPGLVPTDASGPLNDDAATREDYLAQMPLGRTGTVEDVAALVAFLAGPESTWITGQLIGVDGGHSLRRGPDLGALFDPAFADALDVADGTVGPVLSFTSGPIGPVRKDRTSLRDQTWGATSRMKRSIAPRRPASPPGATGSRRMWSTPMAVQRPIVSSISAGVPAIDLAAGIEPSGSR